jgi:peptide/nickel transport system substrate-binding protein
LLNSLTIYLALALVAVLAVSCGSSASPTTAPAAPESAAPAASSPAAEPAAAAQEPMAKAEPAAAEKSQAPVPAAAAQQEGSVTSEPTAVPEPIDSTRMPEGTLRVSEFDFGNESWLPWEDVTQRFYWERVMETLLLLDPVTWEFKPGLAKEWSISEDGKIVTYNLQEDVQFHGGYGEFTASDAAYSLDQWLYNEESTHPSVAAQLQSEPEVVALDTYTVQVNYTKSPFLTAFMDLSSGNNGTGMMSRAYVEEVGLDVARRSAIGTGPYEFVEHKLGESMTVEATEGRHWRIVPQWQTMKFLVTPEASTRLAQILSNEVDIALLPGSFKRQTEAANVRTILNPGVAGVFIVPVVYIPGTTGIDAPDPNNPNADPQFREALSLAINRQELAEVVFAGGAVPTGITDLSPISLGYDAKWEEPDPYDPERAKQLLEESGKAGISFEFQQRPLGGIPEGPQLAEAIAGMWEAVGLDVDLKLNLQGSAHSSLRRARSLEGDIWLMRLGHLTDTTRRLISQYRCTQERTALFACNPELEALTPQIQASLNLEEKDKLIHQAYEIILGERTVIPVVQTASLYAIGPRVGSWKPRIGERFTTELESVGHAQ